MASRFINVDDKMIEELKSSSENANTKKSTEYWTGIFRKWATARELDDKLETYECEALDKADFTLKCEKENTQEYEPDSNQVKHPFDSDSD